MGAPLPHPDYTPQFEADTEDSKEDNVLGDEDEQVVVKSEENLMPPDDILALFTRLASAFEHQEFGTQGAWIDAPNPNLFIERIGMIGSPLSSADITSIVDVSGHPAGVDMDSPGVWEVPGNLIKQ